MRGGSIFDAFKDAGEKIAKGTATLLGTGGDVLDSAGNIISTSGKIAESTFNTTKQLVDVTGKIGVTALNTTNDVTNKSGQAVTSAVGTVAAAVGIVEDYSERLGDYVEQGKEQAIIKNKTATFKIQNASEVKKVEIEASREIEVQKIKNDLEVAQQKTEATQKRILQELTATQMQEYLTSQDNIIKQNQARYYGFTNDNPSSNDIGYITKWLGLSNWCSSFIPQKFVISDNDIIDIIFPDILLEGPRPHYINAINKKTGQPITITFKTITKRNFFGRKYYTEVALIKYNDGQDNDVEIEGKIKYHEIVFLCRSNGGRKRKTNKKRRTIKKDKTNKRRKNNKTNKGYFKG